jgi:hypothetical protein
MSNGSVSVGLCGRVGCSSWSAKLWAAAMVLLPLAAPSAGAAQGLADFDPENLSFQGMMLDVGYVSSSRIESTSSLGGRMDLGLLGPGVRVVTGFNHWSSRLVDREVQELESKLESFILDETGGQTEVDLAEIRWSDVALYGDVHFLWWVPLNLLTYAGLGATAHVLRGSGPAINDTFVDDLLDSVRAGFNVHGGLELPLGERFRIVGEGRYELLEDLRYFQLRIGGQLVFGALAPRQG